MSSDEVVGPLVTLRERGGGEGGERKRGGERVSDST